MGGKRVRPSNTEAGAPTNGIGMDLLCLSSASTRSRTLPPGCPSGVPPPATPVERCRLRTAGASGRAAQSASFLSEGEMVVTTWALPVGVRMG